MSKQIVLSILSAFLGGLLVFLMTEEEPHMDLAAPGIHVDHSPRDVSSMPRRSSIEPEANHLKFAHLERTIQQLKEEAKEQGSVLTQAQDLVAKLQERLRLDDDIPSLEPDLGLTARQEFRLSRLIDMSKDKVIREHRESADPANFPRSVEDRERVMMSMKERARLLNRNLKYAKRNVLIRELGKERASSMAVEALERRNIYAASAKTENQRRTLRSIFNRKNKLAAFLIGAFSADHH